MGDRIHLRAIQIRNGVIVADYNDRGAGQPMAAAPSIPKTIYLKLKQGLLEAVKAP